MANYKLLLKQSVAKDLRPLPKADVARILRRIEALAENPASCPSGSRYTCVRFMPPTAANVTMSQAQRLGLQGRGHKLSVGGKQPHACLAGRLLGARVDHRSEHHRHDRLREPSRRTAPTKAG